MVKQYPYQLWVLTSAAGTQNQSGDFGATGPAAAWVTWSPCRDEANTGGKSLVLEDETATVFDYLIQMPKSAMTLAAGTQVEVRCGSTVRASGTIKRFQRDQLHCRLWV